MKDVYDREGRPTGKTVVKHTPLSAGEFYKHALVILKTRDGRYILQQRSLKDRFLPGQWDVTGGGVDAGETSDMAAIREAREELGLRILREDMTFMLSETIVSFHGYGMITETWFAWADIPEEGFAIDPAEVEDVRLTDADTFMETVKFNKSPAFMAMLEKTKTM